MGYANRIPTYLKKLKSIQRIFFSHAVKYDNMGPIVVQEKWALEKDE